MSIDFSGGLAAEDDLFLPEPPAAPYDWVREGASFWLFEENGAFCVPRNGIEAEPHSWTERRFNANFAFADGRVLIGAGRGAMKPPFNAKGQAAILGGGPLTFECLEPFRKWRVSFDGEVIDSNVRAQLTQSVDASRKTRLRYVMDLDMASPPNIQNITPAAFFTWGKGKQRDAVSVGLGLRFEQMLRGEGELELDGATQSFKLVGSRIKRRSVRTDGLMLRGHCWQAVLFPDGSACGYEARPVHDDGHEPWNEAFIFKNGRMYAGKVIDPPWLREISDAPQDASFTLRSELGDVRIEGTTALSTFRVSNPDIWGLNLQQAGVRYRWGGQEAIGMLERSSVSRGA